MTKRSTKGAPKLGAAERRMVEGIETATRQLREVAAALASNDMDSGADEFAAAFFATCETIFDPTQEPADLAILLAQDGPIAEVLSAFHGERALLGLPIELITDDGQEVDLGLEDLDTITSRIDEIDRLDPEERVKRYLADPSALAIGVGIHLARDGSNEIFPLEPWGVVVMRRCVAAAAIIAATLAAAALSVQEEAGENGDPEPEEVHVRRHEDMDGIIHTAAAATDALSADEREDLSGGGFGVISHLVEDMLYAAADLDPTTIRYLSARLVAAFLRGFSGESPVIEIVDSEDEEVVRYLAGADLAGRLSSERLAPDSEPAMPFGAPAPFIH